MNEQPFNNSLVIVGVVFGVLFVGMYILEVVQPVGKQADAKTAAAPADPKAEPAGGQQRPGEPPEPRKLQVRAQLFEKCHRAMVEYQGSTAALRTEIKLIEFKVKGGDEKELMELFREAASALECKSAMILLGVAADKYLKDGLSQKDEFVRKAWFDTPFGAEAIAWRDQRVVRPKDQAMADKLKIAIPDLEFHQGYISYPKAIEAIEQKLVVLEGTIGIALSD